MARPVIALLTDFGHARSLCRNDEGRRLGDLPGRDARRYLARDSRARCGRRRPRLAAAYRYFPPARCSSWSVDPGVGSTRRGIAADAGEYKFVAPDNGVLTVVLDEHPPRRVVELTERKYARPTVSRTFEGRDRFAPAAAWLAKGIELTAMGRPAGAIARLDLPHPRVAEDEIEGVVLRVDRFGNLITNIDRKTFEKLSGAPLDIQVGSRQVSKVVSTYADATAGDVCALFGSTDHLEIAANGASAAEELGLGRGAPVHIARRA
jgi:S-adenosylmethionine hydrolase